MVDSLGVQKIDEATYRGVMALGKPDRASRGVYGGNLVGQALMVAMSSAREGFQPHSLHAYFVRATTDKSPVEWKVEQVSNGKTFANRHLQATQNGQITFLANISLTLVNDFNQSMREYEAKMEKYNKIQQRAQDSDEADEYDDDDDVEPAKPIQFQTPLLKWLQDDSKLNSIPSDKRFASIATDFKFPVEMVDLTATMEEENMGVTDRKVGFIIRWVPDDEQKRLLASGTPEATVIRYVGLGVLSDAIFLTRLARILRVDSVDLSHLVHYYSTSLDHVVYFHDADFDPTQWMKFQFKATRFGNRRVVLEAEIFNHCDLHVATVVQEGLVYFNGLEKYAKL